MGDTGDLWRESKELQQRKKELNRNQATADYDQAARLAKDHGLELRKISAVHYQLIRPKPTYWILNIYPGNQRLYGDNKHRPPFVEIKAKPWNLNLLVSSVITQLQL